MTGPKTGSRSLRLQMKRAINLSGRPLWAEIDLKAVQRNFAAVRCLINSNCTPGQQPRMVLAVVKANAYGHGAVPIVKALARAGADWFGVASVSEGAELRDAGIRRPILVLGGYWPGEEKLLVDLGLTPAVTNCDQLPLLEHAVANARHRTHRRFGFHLKINTGMNRLGIALKDVDCFAHAMANCPHLKLKGTFTHFASSEVLDSDETDRQEKCFTRALSRMNTLGLSPGLIHMANSGALASRPSSWAGMVRPGAAIYGYLPNYCPTSRQKEFELSLCLEPALSLRTRLVAIRNLEPGEGVGYNAKFVATKPSRIAVIAAGYADGLRRELRSRGGVIVRGQFTPIIGSISMDTATIDVTDVAGATVGDIATICGTDGQLSQTAADLSFTLGTVVQDVLCSIGTRVRRIYLD